MSKLSEREFLELIEKHKDEFYRFVRRSVWNESDVEDVFSEAVMVAWEKRERFQVGTNFRAWFYKILLNKSYVANRHTKRNSVDYDAIAEVNLEEVDNEEMPKAFSDPKYFLDQVGDELLDALNKLRTPERTCLLLRASDSCSYKEIAAIMDIPVGTVMTHLARGRSKIKKFLREEVKSRSRQERSSVAPVGAGTSPLLAFL